MMSSKHTSRYKYSWAITATFLWAGFVGAISFMEAWLKFKAPDVSLAEGLQIGQLVFAALNKVEWVLCVVISMQILLNRHARGQHIFIWFLISSVILIVQTFWLLPRLDARADLIIAGGVPPATNIHWYYVGVEVIKEISLITLGAQLLFSHRNELYGNQLQRVHTDADGAPRWYKI